MQQSPKRIQRHRTKGWRLPPNAVYVGRETRWGHRWMPGHFWWAEERARVFVEVYREALVNRLRRNPQLLDPLRGKDLACWCPLDRPCHADVLLEFANQQVPGVPSMPDSSQDESVR